MIAVDMREFFDVFVVRTKQLQRRFGHTIARLGQLFVCLFCKCVDTNAPDGGQNSLASSRRGDAREQETREASNTPDHHL